MQNVRHLWSSVRPNGDRRPYCLNRLELRICDLIANPINLLAIAALLEARLQQVLVEPSLDPLLKSQLAPTELLALADANEGAAARDSLNASLRHWQDGRTILARDWLEELYQEMLPVAKQGGFSCFLSPLKKILREGNQAQQWLAQYEQGKDIPTILKQAIVSLEWQEAELEDNLCQFPLAA
jgi:predicted glutamate--cysteine ligase